MIGRPDADDKRACYCAFDPMEEMGHDDTAWDFPGALRLAGKGLPKSASNQALSGQVCRCSGCWSR